MKQSVLFTKTSRDISKEAEALNHKLLLKGGFIDQLSSGIFTLLPLGLRVVKKIENIVREEINSIGGQEILMPALIPKENWQKTDRWNLDVAFKTKSNYGKKEYGLGWTHEEVVTPLVKKFTASYRDLPKAVYQIQTKFRDEARPKAGLFRVREFSMKDLYSFHKDEKDLESYYQTVKERYYKIYEKVGIRQSTYLTFASGGEFSKYSHEFQMISSFGEDTIFICDKCEVAINKEIVKGESVCPNCGSKELKEERAIEVGNIFKLNDKFSKPFNLTFTNDSGKENIIVMGCYGFGITRTFGAVAEVYNDKNGLMWPSAVAPFAVHLLNLEESVKKSAEKIYENLNKENIEVLWDDRNLSAAEKFKDSDLIGIPLRIIVSNKNIKLGKLEIKKRALKEPVFIEINRLVPELKKML